MVILIFRLLFFLAVLAGLYYVLVRIFNPSDFVRCGRCDGKGYWYAARGRETCDWCKGSGKLPRQKQH